MPMTAVERMGARNEFFYNRLSDDDVFFRRMYRSSVHNARPGHIQSFNFQCWMGHKFQNVVDLRSCRARYSADSAGDEAMNIEREVLQDQFKSALWPGQNKAAGKMVAVATQTYKEVGERAAMRCAMGDAASLCDAIVRDIEAGHRGRGGRISIAGQKQATVAKLCAEAIWLMREKISVSDEFATSPDCNGTR